ncbi:MAG: aa3-type cytochrome c oxidase subunit IV [Pseudomonadota bacterium]
MAETDYTHGKMDIAEQERTFEGFLTGTVWGSGIIILVLGYATLTVATGMHWMVALGLMAGLGIGGGFFMGLGISWFAAVIGMTALAVVVQIIIGLFGLIA